MGIIRIVTYIPAVSAPRIGVAIRDKLCRVTLLTESCKTCAWHLPTTNTRWPTIEEVYNTVHTIVFNHRTGDSCGYCKRVALWHDIV
eukprot:9501742-Pyramimonas_sp.AAC.1